MAIAARMEKRRMPYVRRGVGPRLASTVPAQARTSPSTSPRLWPASEISASEFVRSPKPISATTNATLSPTPMAKARSKFAGAWAVAGVGVAGAAMSVIMSVIMAVRVPMITMVVIMVVVSDTIRRLPHTEEASDGRRARPCGLLLPRWRRGWKLGEPPLHRLELRRVGAQRGEL